MINKYEIDSVASKSFYIDEKANPIKIHKLIRKAEAIRDFKNQVSVAIFEDAFKYIELGKFSAMTEFKANNQFMNGQDEQNAIQDVYDTYANKFDTLNSKLKFSLIDIKPNFYKKDGKIISENKRTFYKGQFKSFSKKNRSTTLTKVLSYLARYGNENTETYLNETIKNETNEDKILFYEMILSYILKFGFERLLSVSQMRRDNIKRKLFIEPHKFESLSFRTVSRIKDDIVSFNKNKNSVIRGFINIGGFLKEEVSLEKWGEICKENEIRRSQNKSALKTKSESLSLPFKYNKNYHENLSDYLKDVTSYTVVFDSKKKVRVVLTKETKRNIYSDDLKDKPSNIVGVDTNIKHNMFYDSEGNVIDYDRDTIKDFVKFINHVNGKKAHKKRMGLDNEMINTMSEKDRKTQSYYIRKITYDLKSKSSLYVNMAMSNGFNHIVMEDLDKVGRTFFKSDTFDGVKYSKLWSILHIGGINDIVKSICYKKGLSFTLIQPEYTSQQCSVCGCVDKGNRKTQEVFECIACGHTECADGNSPKNIKYRVVSDVLREKLLNRSPYSELAPKKLGKDAIKEILINYSEGRQFVANETADVLGCHCFP